MHKDPVVENCCDSCHGNEQESGKSIRRINPGLRGLCFDEIEGLIGNGRVFVWDFIFRKGISETNPNIGDGISNIFLHFFISNHKLQPIQIRVRVDCFGIAHIDHTSV